MFLSVKQLSWQVENVRVLRDINVDIDAGEVIGIIGPNGAGKTSLLNCIVRIIDDYTGTISIANATSDSLSRRQLAHHFALVSQQPSSIFDISVFDVVRMGLLPHKSLFERDTEQDLFQIEYALNKVGLEHAQSQYFNELSGGEQQRALIARALVQKAKILVLDEPTNHLDVHYQHQILKLINELGITVLMTVHDLNLASQYCDRLILLEKGKVRAQGSIEQVLNKQLLEEVFDLPCMITQHPKKQVPHVIFYSKDDANE